MADAVITVTPPEKTIKHALVYEFEFTGSDNHGADGEPTASIASNIDFIIFNDKGDTEYFYEFDKDEQAIKAYLVDDMTGLKVLATGEDLSGETVRGWAFKLVG